MEAVKPAGKKKFGKYEDYEIENAVDTIVRAEEIKNDTEKMKYVKPLLVSKLAGMKKTIESFSDLQAARDKANGNDYEDAESADEEMETED